MDGTSDDRAPAGESSAAETPGSGAAYPAGSGDDGRLSAAASDDATSRFLAAASDALSRSLDEETTRSTLVSLVVPALADWCAVHVRGHASATRLAAVAHADPSLLPPTRDLLDRSATLRDAVERLFQAGAQASPLLPAKEADPSRGTASASALDRPCASSRDGCSAAGDSSIVSLPLVAAGEVIGVLTIAAERSTGEAVPLALVQEVARRAATMLAHAKRFRAAQDALTTRGEFLGTVSHDLRTPLSTIGGHAQLLRRRAVRLGALQAEQLLPSLGEIEKTVAHMAAQVDDLLDIARLEMGRSLDLNPHPCDMLPLLRRVAAATGQVSGRHRLIVTTDIATFVGEWDAIRIERVLANLVDNAIKYSPDGGDVAISVSRLARDGDWGAAVTIRDGGMGIPADELPHIFDRFYRGRAVAGKIRGNGIGLASARTIVEQHGGAVTVESEVGVGSTFTVWLPLRPPTWHA